MKVYPPNFDEFFTFFRRTAPLRHGASAQRAAIQQAERGILSVHRFPPGSKNDIVFWCDRFVA